VKSPSRLFKEWTEDGLKLIYGEHGSMVSKLIELFPSAAPKFWSGRRLRVEMNEKVEWMIFRYDAQRPASEQNGQVLT
jgi:hypothetical protein